jgi:type I restriction enzyme R subunit
MGADADDSSARHARFARLRGLVRFVEKTKQNPIYTDFEDTLEESTLVDLPQVTSGMSWERFRAKAQAYPKAHENHVALQRLRRNKQLTADDLDSLAEMLVAAAGDQRVDLDWVTQRTGVIGPCIRSLVGLDRAAANEAFATFLDGSRFSVEQIRLMSSPPTASWSRPDSTSRRTSTTATST